MRPVILTRWPVLFADGMVTGRMEDNSERSEANHTGTKEMAGEGQAGCLACEWPGDFRILKTPV